MISIETVFAPIIGQFVWGAQQGVGSFLTMEFGDPHLRVREPLPAASSPILHRRSVHPAGQWHLWLLYCDWAIETPTVKVVAADWENKTLVSEVLVILNGQRLTNASLDTTARLTQLLFERDTTISVKPMAEEIEDDLWSLYVFRGSIFSYTNHGDISVVDARPNSN